MQVTIGRIVIYRPTEKDLERWQVRDLEAVPAIVAHVKSGAEIRASLFALVMGSGVQQVYKVKEGTGPGTWSWPARAESAAKEATTPI